MLLDDMFDLLTSGGFSTGIVFRGVLPPNPDAALALYEVGGLPPYHVMGGSVPAERPGLQVVSRAADYETARDNAHLAFGLVDGLAARTINGVRYLWAEARQSPFGFGRDESERVLVAFNADVVKEMSTTS